MNLCLRLRASLFCLALLVACAGDSGVDPAALPLPPRASLDPVVLAAIERAIEGVETRGRRDAAAWGELAELLDAHDLFDAAAVAYAAAAALAPEVADWPYLLGHLELRRGGIAAAEAAFLRAHAIDPLDPLIAVAAASVLNQSGRFDRALSLVEPVTRAHDGLAIGWFVLGEAARGAGDPARAVEAFERVQQLQPQASRVARLLAVELRRAGRAPEAMQQEARAGDAPVQVADPRRERVARRMLGFEADVGAANAALQAGRPVEAQGHWRRALLARPQDRRALLGLGSTLVQLGRREEGAALYRRVLEQDPADPMAHFNLAVLAARDGDDAGAIRHGEAALAADAGLHDARFNLANALRRAGRGEEAAEHYRRVLAAQPGRPAAWHALAALQAERGDWAAAAESLKEGLARAPQDEGLVIARIRLLATAPQAELRDAALALREAESLRARRGGAMVQEALALALAASGHYAAAEVAALAAVDEAWRQTALPAAVRLRLEQVLADCRSRQTPRPLALD